MAMVTRFRAATRDNRVDAERMGAVQSEVRKALRSIEREQDGLGQRLEEARARAATLMGTEDGIYGEREPADEKLLVEAEAQMMSAYDRLKALKSQHAVLASVARELDRTEAAGLRPQRPAPAQPPAGWLGARSLWSDPARLRQGAAMLGWALLIGILLSLVPGAAPSALAASFTPDLTRFLAFLGAAAALGIGYPRHRLALFGAGLACLLVSATIGSVVMTQDGALLAAPVKALGLVVALALPPVVQWLFRYRQRRE